LAALPRICSARRGHQAHEADALALPLEVVVAPFPLIAGRLDGDVGLGGVAHVEQGLGGRPGHGHQDQQRHDGPGDLDQGVVVELGGLACPFDLRCLNDRIEHDGKDADEDDDDHPQQKTVQLVDAARDSGGWFLQIKLPGCVRRAAEQAEQCGKEASARTAS
jgi:hypothetical protein